MNSAGHATTTAPGYGKDVQSMMSQKRSVPSSMPDGWERGRNGGNLSESRY